MEWYAACQQLLFNLGDAMSRKFIRLALKRVARGVMNPCLAFTFALTLGFSWASLSYVQDEAGVATALAVQDEVQATEAENNAEAENSEGQQAEVASASDEASTVPEFKLDFKIGDNLNVEHAVQNIDGKLEQWLHALGVSKNLHGKLLGSGGLLLMAMLAWWMLRRFFVFLEQKSQPLVMRYRLNNGRIQFNIRLVKAFFRMWLLFLAMASLLSVWNLSIFNILPEERVYWVLQSVVSIFAILMLASILIELAGGIVEKAFARFGGAGNTRMQTLLPIAKNLIFIIIFTLFGLTLLSELGINVMPLLAGAGVVGFAIGFGAQTFVKDLITGFIIILEDLVQVGDVITVGGRSGVVERITIRKIQLRNLEGIVSTVPFSEISIVDNFTKHFSYYLLNVGVAYRENTDEVVKLLNEVDESLRNDEEFAPDILDKLEVLGVDKFADSAVIIKARIKTKPIQQWRIGREFNRRMKFLFDEHNIEIPFPHQTVYFGEDKQGRAPAAHVDIHTEKLGALASAND